MLTETKTLNGWIRENGYKWVEGQELIIKGEMSSSEANYMIQQLVKQGAVTNG